MRWKRWLLVTTGILLAGAAGFLAAVPRARAAFRLTPHLITLDGDPRVRYEPGAREAARQVAASLPAVLTRIEAAQGRPFKPGFRVVVCASHKRFAHWIGHAPDSPVMGIAMPFDVWLSPALLTAAGRDRHREGLGHELSHLHFNQHLFWYSRLRQIPLWFSEGLADWASGWEPDRVSRDDALRALRQGPRMTPETRGYLSLAKGSARSGVSWPMMHRQGVLFIEYLVETDEAAFHALVHDLLDGIPFSDAFRQRFGYDLAQVWARFLTTI